MRKNRFEGSGYPEFRELPSSMIASALANVTEATLGRAVFTLILTVPSARRRYFKILLITLLLGAILGGLTFYYAPRVFDYYLGSALAGEKAAPDRAE